ncbi:MAG TPA: hypothetical protein VK504_11025 [Vicinamibacterales bacterium]|nr:hypothetical protein [Vicinamibacterales bacterium]
MGKYVSNAKAVDAKLETLIKARLQQEGVRIVRDIDALFTAPKHGRLYGATSDKVAAYRKFRAGKRKRRPGGVHRASRPGEAPAIWHAFLRKGIRFVLQRNKGMSWSLIVGVTAQSGRGARNGSDQRSIAERLEFGTSKMKPRPYFRVALAMMRERIAGGVK